MKKLLLLFALLFSAELSQTTYAQVNVQVNIGNQPVWGPTGYDYVDYYYLPDLDIYYYVPLQQWVYFNGARWITTTVLPPQYSNYDLYRMHKVVINEKQPYLRNTTFRKQYASFKGRYDQQPIRDSRDQRYFVIKDHPQHSKAVVTKNSPQSNRNTGVQNQSRGAQVPNSGPQAQNGKGQNRNGAPQGQRAGQQQPRGNARGAQGRPGNH